ncbi:MAG TPA: arginase family protein [Gemmatimonadota bacterium]|nr:arginase family protein [Gemmatimonadota bacterium]
MREDDGSPCDGALVGLPFDAAIPTRPGARRGPDALRAALTRFAADQGEAQWPAGARLTDLGDVDLARLTVAEAHDRIGSVLAGVLGRVVWLAAIGGDHSLTFPVFQALAAARGGSWGLIALDAHHDVRPYSRDSITSGTPFRRCLELGPGVLAPERLVQIGIRRYANIAGHRAWCEERGVAIYDVEAVRGRGWKMVADEALTRAVGDADHLYVSLDLDVVDQAEAPGTSAAGPEGLAAAEALSIVERLAGHPRFAAGDIMELSPRWDPAGLTARLAARALLAIVAARWPAAMTPIPA